MSGPYSIEEFAEMLAANDTPTAEVLLRQMHIPPLSGGRLTIDTTDKPNPSRTHSDTPQEIVP